GVRPRTRPGRGLRPVPGISDRPPGAAAARCRLRPAGADRRGRLILALPFCRARDTINFRAVTENDETRATAAWPAAAQRSPPGEASERKGRSHGKSRRRTTQGTEM